MDKLKREKGELGRLINVYDETSAQFDQMTSRGGQSRNQKDGQDLTEKTIYSPQYGDALVNNLLELGTKMADPEFRKTLINKKVELAIRLQKVETEIDVFGGSSSSSSRAISKVQILGYLAKAADDLTDVANSLGAIVKSYNSYAFNQQGSLYSMSGSIEFAEGYGLNDPKLKLKVVLGFILGGMLSVFWVWGRRLVL